MLGCPAFRRMAASIADHGDPDRAVRSLSGGSNLPPPPASPPAPPDVIGRTASVGEEIAELREAREAHRRDGSYARAPGSYPPAMSLKKGDFFAGSRVPEARSIVPGCLMRKFSGARTPTSPVEPRC
jgi:hypothetical protein